MANQDDSFMRELEEELRRERIEKIWKEYGTYILAGAVVIVVGVLGYKYVEHSRMVSAQTQGARYEDALTLAQEGKDGSAAKEFETIATEGSGYASLARLQLAGSLLKQGKKPEALAAYEALANESGADPLLREFAAVQAAAVRLGEADFTEMQNRLTPLMGDAQPWRYSARELLGMAAFKAGNDGEAKIILTPLLVDRQVPQSILERVQIVMAEIAAKELAKKAGNEAPAPAAKAAESTPAPPAAKAAESTPAAAAPVKTKKE